MDFATLTRVPTKAHDVFLLQDGSYVAKKPCKILVPEAWLGTELGNMGEVIRVLATFAIVVDDKYYGVSQTCALMDTVPSRLDSTMIGNDKYVVFCYEVGDKIMVNAKLPKISTLVYRIYYDFISNGNIPAFLDAGIKHSDVTRIFDTSLTHGGANLRGDHALLELLAGNITRQREDMTKYYRHQEDKSIPPVIVPLNSVAYGATNTTAKIVGNRLNEGLTSALVAPSDTNEQLEDLLRG